MKDVFEKTVTSYTDSGDVPVTALVKYPINLVIWLSIMVIVWGTWMFAASLISLAPEHPVYVSFGMAGSLIIGLFATMGGTLQYYSMRSKNRKLLRFASLLLMTFWLWNSLLWILTNPSFPVASMYLSCAFAQGVCYWEAKE